ncbi:hypothetical protein N9980_00555 [bacterium]|nr:hypothetical protein [bacterium]
MNKLMQAVNDLRGDLGNGEFTHKDYHDSHQFLTFNYDDGYWSLHTQNKGFGTVSDFNDLVKELSEAKWIPERDEVELLTDRDGNQYQKGKRYLFSDNGSCWDIRILRCVVKDYGHQFFTNTKSAAYRYCKVDDTEAGTITYAPVELVGGCAYQFTWIGSTTCGIYNQETECFEALTDSLSVSACRDITPLAPEIK